MPGSAIRQRRRNDRFASPSGKQSARQRQQLFAEAVGEQAVAADAHESLGQHMQEESAEEVHCVEGHDALLAAVGIIAPAEADAISVECGDAVVGNRHAVGVAAEVAKNMFGSTEGRLGVDVPVLVFELFDQLLEHRGITESSSRPSQVEQSSVMKSAESGEELLAEDSAQDRNGQQEHRMAGRNPALMIGRQSATGNDAMNMVVRQQVRTPCVQDGEEPDLGAEALGIASDFKQGLRDGFEEQIENRPARCQCQRVQLMGQSEDDVKVVGVDEIAPLSVEPYSSCLGLALGATARTAGVKRDRCFVLATFTLILMPAEGSSAAALHGPISLQLLIAESGLEALEKLPALATDDVGHFDGRPRHERGRW